MISYSFPQLFSGSHHLLRLIPCKPPLLINHVPLAQPLWIIQQLKYFTFTYLTVSVFLIGATTLTASEGADGFIVGSSVGNLCFSNWNLGVNWKGKLNLRVQGFLPSDCYLRSGCYFAVSVFGGVEIRASSEFLCLFSFIWRFSCHLWLQL